MAQTDVFGVRDREAAGRRWPSSRGSRLLGGGTDGNEQLTAIVAVVLLVMFAVLGVTIVRIGQLIWLHLFLGLLLLGPVVAKLASTGYRFLRYYMRNRSYRLKGPPPPVMRLIAPMVVVTSVVVFASGIVLLADGPASRDQFLLIHKASFIAWLAFVALHVLGHLSGLGGTLRAAVRPPGAGGTAGAAGRWIMLSSALVAGLVIAVALVPDFTSWTAHSSVFHHHHHH